VCEVRADDPEWEVYPDGWAGGVVREVLEDHVSSEGGCFAPIYSARGATDCALCSAEDAIRSLKDRLSRPPTGS
jgi:hypothetical protein